MNKMQRREMLRLSNMEAQSLSRECLETALFRLMEKKDFDRISIGEIVELAGVSRNAFYRNYKTKENLLESLSQTVAVKLRNALPQYGHASQEAYTRFFQFVSENAESFRILLSVRSYLANHLTGSIKDYREIAWAGALSQITILWFESGMQESTTKMGCLCSECLHGLENSSR